jgi:hypothetical protein
MLKKNVSSIVLTHLFEQSKSFKTKLKCRTKPTYFEEDKEDNVNKVLFIHQLMHQWVLLKIDIKIYIKIYINLLAPKFYI